MLPDHQPTHVREEKASFRIMGISDSFAALVMGAVVPGPRIDRVLSSHTVGEAEEDSQRKFRLVGFVGPKSMGARRDSKS